MYSVRLNDFGEGLDEGIHLFGGADGDAQFVEQAGLVEKSNKDIVLGQLLVDGPGLGLRRDGGQQEVGVAVADGEAELAECDGESPSLLFDPGDGGVEVVLIGESGDGGGLGGGVDVVGVFDFDNGFDDGGGADQVAETKAGERIAFAHAAEQDDVVEPAGQVEAVVFGEIDVGFIDQEDAAELTGQFFDFGRRDEGGGGGVGIAEDGERCVGVGQGLWNGEIGIEGDFDGGAVLDFGQGWI